MFPLAPGRLSTITDWPRISPSFIPIVRARRSLPPPGETGTINLIGFSGYLESAALGVAAKEPLLFVEAAFNAKDPAFLAPFVSHVVRMLANRQDAAQATKVIVTMAKQPGSTDGLGHRPHRNDVNIQLTGHWPTHTARPATTGRCAR